MNIYQLIQFLLQANMWLGTLLLERSDDIYRMKGLLCVEGMDERFVFQVCTISRNYIFFKYWFTWNYFLILLVEASVDRVSS